LTKYYSVGGSGKLASVEVDQTAGNLPSNSFAVENGTFNLVISTNDLRLDNTVSMFRVCAYLSSVKSDCTLTVTVTFKKASEAQKIA